MEDLPFLELHSDDGSEYVITPENSKLYTFAGRTLLENGDYSDNAQRNHVYIIDRERDQGTYIFGKKNVDNIGGAMLSMQFPASLYQRTVPKYDEEAYQIYLTNKSEAEDTPDELPDWMDEDGTE